MKTLLVTGGAGFIGSNFIRYMIDKYKNYKIINLDLLTYAGNLENLKDIEHNPNYEFIKGDISDKKLVDKIVSKKVDYIINFAAASHVDRSIEDPEVFIRTNIMGTQVLLDAAKKYNIEKYVQISTDEVYGSLGKEGLFIEETPIAPNSPYAASKAAADLLVRAYYKTYKLAVNITRCSNNYGPYQFPEKLIPLMIANAYENRELPVYGDGLQIRDWLHVKDHCRAIDLVLHKGKIGEVYNVGGNNEKANIYIVKFILEKLKKSETLIRYVEDRLGHDRRYAIDSSKIQNELGWKPKYDFERGIEETINWYLDNKNWWKKLISRSF
ncbi:dTDP-glucose 4,6-dehydratase [Anaeromicrobium sediminis]|uniref:dTDP-glucose 4,6-dehydratase n=1 Tax=Anaeromicrobium sediminis TaxID=1478221 RepID=A0A267MK23_9FIRM|nr:dTDP-glucose 4,6-dehydratase [Anaeromicrobium sediminis]PAB59143.1 dTDP-glucose 4,6-dehydratase [Anaeromicrobium sediminis]